MYATAMFVRSSGAQEGVNAYLHAHDEGLVWPEQAERLPETNPGNLIDSDLDLPPPGNRVQAYLDVLAPEGTPSSAIAHCLDVLEDNLGGVLLPAVFRVGRVTVVFGADLGLEAERGQHLHRLRGRLERLCKWPQGSEVTG